MEKGGLLKRGVDYKNHRIFTLRCLYKELIPVSIKLKSTLKTEKAWKIIRKAEKDLLQARIKAINSILDNITKQTQECRSQLASIISAQRLRKCQGFIDKVGEIRFAKVKQRQLNKYNILLNKKEGNITRANTTTNPSNLVSQAGRQASALLPPGEESNLSQAGRQALLPPGEGSNLSQAGTHLPCREVSNSLQAGRQVLSFPSGKEAVLPRQLLTFLLGKEAVSPRQLHTFLPGKEAIYLRQTGRQAGTLLPPGEGSNSLQAGSQAGALLPLGEGSSSSQATAHLSLGEGSSISQAIAHLPPGEGSNSLPATAHLPPREGSSSSQATAHLPSGEAGSSSQVTAHLPPGEGNSSPQSTTHPNNQTRSGRQGFRHSNRHRASQGNSTVSRQTVPTPRKVIPPLPSPVGSPKGLLMKKLTPSRSLTYPANL